VTAIRDVVEKAHVPFVGTNGSPSDLTSVYYMWRVSYVDGQAGRVLAPRVYREYRSAYLLGDDTPGTRDEVGNFRSVYNQLGGRVVADVVATDRFAERLRAAQNSSAAAIFAAYSGATAAQFIQAYRAAGIRKPLFGPGSLTEGVDPARLMEGALPPKIYTAMNYATNLDNPENRRFIVLYTRAMERQPTAYAMAAYDAASVIDDALRAVGGEPTAVGLNGGFSRLGQIDSPRGTWAFTITRTPQQRWYLRRLRRDGQVPVNLADEDLDLPR
jgi:branched-chain amino acid transport system substrate-binding protein